MAQIWRTALQISGAVAGAVVSVAKPVALISEQVGEFASEAVSALGQLRALTDSPHIPRAMEIFAKVSRMSRSINAIATHLRNSAAEFQNSASYFSPPSPPLPGDNLIVGVTDLLLGEEGPGLAAGAFKNIGLIAQVCERSLADMNLQASSATVDEVRARMQELRVIVAAHFPAAAGEEAAAGEGEAN